MNIRFFIATTFLFLGTLSSRAQSPEALFQLALDNNRELRSLEQHYLAALEKPAQVSQLPNPEIGLGSFVLPVETRLGPQRARFSATQMFPWFGTLDAKEDLSSAQAEIVLTQLTARQWELLYQIKIAWFSLYAYRTDAQILQRNQVVLEALKSLTESKVAAGRASLADVLRVDLQLNALAQERKLLALSEGKPLATLNQLLQRPLDTPIAVPDSLAFEEWTFEADSLLARIQATHPLLQQFLQQQEVARMALQLNEKEAQPTLGIGMDYLLVGPRGDATPENNGRDIVQIRATVSLPLNREKYAAKAREEQLTIEALESRREEMQSYFLMQIEQALITFEQAQLMQELYQQQMQTTRAAIQILEADYSNSNRSFEELLRLERDQIDYERKILQAIVQSHVAKAQVDRFLPY